MSDQIKKELEEYAKSRANEVYDIDMDELIRLVLDGAKWMDSKLKTL